MNTLSELILSMNKEEIRHYKLYTGRFGDNEERKDVALFDFLRKEGIDANEEVIFQQLYATDDKNAYYRLKNRLQQELGCALSLLHIDKNDTNNLLWILSLYEILRAKEKWELAHYFLRKAEKKALEIENLELLDLIYAKFILLSNEVMDINPEIYISKRDENAIKLNKTRNIDQVLAALNYRIKVSQNFARQDKNLLKIVDKTLKEFSTDNSIKNNKTFQTKVYRLISQTLVQRHSFIELEKFMLDTYEQFESNNWFEKANHDTKLQMLVYIINAKHFNSKFQEALQYASILGKEITRFDNLFYDKYLFFYYNSLVANYAKLNFAKAIESLDAFESLMRKRKNNYYDQFIYLNRATLSYERGKFNDGIRALVKFYLNDSFQKADGAFQLKIEVTELIMQYESKDFASTKKRIEQVRKKHLTRLKQSGFYREAKVIHFIEQMMITPLKDKEAALYKEIQSFVNKKISAAEEDGEIKKYRSWLAPKVGIRVDSLKG
ncbi:MAG: hypothetical protein U0T32_02110 [Chitinophagales bacterium]